MQQCSNSGALVILLFFCCQMRDVCHLVLMVSSSVFRKSTILLLCMLHTTVSGNGSGSQVRLLLSSPCILCCICNGTDCTYVDLMFLLRLIDCRPEAFDNFWFDKLMFYTKIFRTNFEWKIAALTWAIIACKQTSALENIEVQARWYNEMSSLWKFLCLFLLVSRNNSSRLSKTSFS